MSEKKDNQPVQQPNIVENPQIPSKPKVDPIKVIKRSPTVAKNAGRISDIKNKRE
jgi:hypothetical protein